MFDCLILDNFHFCSEFAQPTGGCQVHLFIDEFVINHQTLSAFDDINKKIDATFYVWLSVARATNEANDMFKSWLEEKRKIGYVIPTLEYPLRNSIEILEFEKKLETNMTTEAFVSNPESFLKPIKPSLEGRLKPDKVFVTFNMHQRFGSS